MADNQKDKIFSSFTFKIVAAMMLVALVPIGLSLFIFERIDSFNQDLQHEAVDSIDAAAEVYRAYVQSESELMKLIERNLELEVDTLLQKHKIQRMSEVRLSAQFRSDLQALFDSTVEDNPLVVDVRLVYNMEPVVRSGQMPGIHENYKFRTVDVPVAIRSRFNGNTEQADVTDTTEVPILIAEPVDYNENENIINEQQDDSVPSLPDKLDDSAFPRASSQGVKLLVIFAEEMSQLQHYEKLGERRNLHGSISAVENDGGMSVTDIYQAIFVTAGLVFLLLALICAFRIALPLSRRLTALTHSMRQMANGDLNAKVDVSGNDQVAFMMTQFNTMVDDVRTAQESKAYIERMQAWREVARRLAHEIKNPLTPIVLAIQQLDKKFDDYIDRPQKYRKMLTDAVEIVNEETETLRKLVKNFTEFARMPIPELKEAKFYDFVKQTINQNPQFFENAKITVHPVAENIEQQVLSFDPELMRRVIVNLVRNGIEASENAHLAPEIDIHLSLLAEDKKNENNTFCLQIIDHGPGLTDEQKSNLFRPYFTTKSDGTGLGLSIVRKIIEDHKGHISLHDRDDHERGTQVDIVL